METTDTGDMFIIFMILIPIFWGVSVGRRVGLRYWLFDSFEGVSLSLGVPFSGFLSFIQLDMLKDGKDPSILFLAFCILLFLYWSAQSFKLCLHQTSSIKDTIGLFLGKMVFGVASLGLFIFIAFLFGKKK